VATYARVFDALAHPTRRLVLEQLRRGPSPVGELAGVLPISQPAVSQHLRVLQEAELVAVRPEGNRRIYSINRSGIAELRRYIDDLWSDALDRFADEARAQAEGTSE
jgi:DNA-binding transcriptional ArsR family regulator